MIRFVTDAEEKEKIASFILNELPDWFGMPEHTLKYISESCKMPFWANYENEIPKGFIALKETSPFTAEIYVMGVVPNRHHCGIGTALFNEFLLILN